MNRRTYGKYAWALTAYNIGVILFGAVVRATGSGAGCGSHWPLCNGEVVPRAPRVQTIIEFTHRLTSGFDGLLVLALVLFAFRLYPRMHRVRIASLGVLFFTIVEALVGAALVKFGWVDQDRSPIRAVVMSVHLVNTLLLLSMCAATALFAQGVRPLRLRSQGALGWAIGIGLAGVMGLGVSGAVTALGDTLFPAKDSLYAIERSLAPGAHFLERLRILHPLMAMTVGLIVILVSAMAAHLRPDARVKRWGTISVTLLLLQMIAGGVNVLLKAPVAMQVLHLLLANLLWLSVFGMSFCALSRGVKRAEAAGPVHLAAASSAELPPVTWRDYLALTKPRVISLLLFTTLAAMVIAAGGWPGTMLFAAVAVGGYMAAGAANTINMVVDRDIDGLMKRTSTRPTVTQRIPSTRALAFGFTLAFASFVLLWAAANLLTAVLAFAGLVFYVVIYTLVLKRRTWQNIVIGGAAGAFPPLVGWASVTGDLSPLAWYLFAIIFLWTPVHFWALALLLKEDYAEAGVPMLPVIRGERATVRQIAVYAVLTAVISAVPFLNRDAGWLYLVAVIALNLVLLQQSVELYRLPERRQASRLFHYSMLYLALLFLVMALDRSFITPPRMKGEPHTTSADKKTAQVDLRGNAC